VCVGVTVLGARAKKSFTTIVEGDVPSCVNCDDETLMTPPDGTWRRTL
jgi:hypothetical protein